MTGKTGHRTRAQEVLLAYLKATPGVHHTAAELKEHFAAEGTPIGTATIYRQLERFVDEGHIRKYFIGTGESTCCAQGIEFIWGGEHQWPDDYPEETTDIIVTGRLEIYDEDGYQYLHLVDAELLWEPSVSEAGTL